MRLTGMITLCLSILLFREASSSLKSVLKDQLASYDKAENVVEKFFFDFNKALDKIKPWLVLVVARNDEDLQSIELSFESHPHMICVKVENCEIPKEFQRRDVVIIMFIDDLSKKTIKRNMKILLTNRGHVLFVLDQHKVIKNDMLSFSQEIIRRSRNGLIEFVHFKKSAVNLYSIEYTKDCSTDIVLDMAWKVGSDLSKLTFFDRADFDMKGCPLPVGTFPSLPKMMMEQKEDGSFVITGGRSGRMINEIADQLNFKIIPKIPSEENRRLTNSKKLAVINEIYSGVVSLGIGAFRATNYFSETAQYSEGYDVECLTWGVPRITNKVANNIIWAELEWKVWVGIGLVFFIACGIEYVHENLIVRLFRNGERRNVDLSSIVLNGLAINLGNPVSRKFVHTSSRIIFIAFTFYAVVTTTGYKTSLASILMTQKSKPAVSSTKGIIKANFTVGGSEYYLHILKDQVNSSKYIPKLIERFVIIDKDSVAMERLKSSKNFALLTRASYLMHMKKLTVEARELITFDILKECVLSYYAVVVFNKYSPLVKFVDREISKLIESGILNYWGSFSYVDDKILERRNSDLLYKKFMKDKFKVIFIFYGCGIAISTFVFLLELLWPRIMKRRKRGRRARPRRC